LNIKNISNLYNIAKTKKCQKGEGLLDIKVIKKADFSAFKHLSAI